MITVLVVDDHALVRAGMCSRLEQQGLVIGGEASSVSQAIVKARSLQPDLVLLDILLPTGNGLEAIPELRKVSPDSKILVVSSQASASSVRQALTAGAAGFMSKHSSDQELLGAIRRIAAGEQYVDASLGAKLVIGDRVPALEPLSERERDVLQVLALGYTNHEIAKRLYISVRTVDTHRAHIMRKLRLGSRAELVMFALANGLIGPC